MNAACLCGHARHLHTLAGEEDGGCVATSPALLSACRCDKFTPAQDAASALRVAYADPPYPGQSAKHYADHPDFAGEVDHGILLQSLEYDYDGFCLHTSSTALISLLALADTVLARPQDIRVMAWVKPFAAFKRNVSVAYAWEPVLVKAARKPVVKPGMVYRDYVAESITMKRGLTGAKPEKVCHWLFEVMGCEPQDELCDLFPGSGAVSRAWESWQMQLRPEAVA